MPGPMDLGTALADWFEKHADEPPLPRLLPGEATRSQFNPDLDWAQIQAELVAVTA